MSRRHANPREAVSPLPGKTHCSAGWLGELSLGHHVVGFPPCILPPDDIFGRFLESAFNIAVATGRTVYDSMDLALATALGCKLVTADQKLYNALQGGPFAADVLWVADPI